jgi:hypothetical protein
MNKHITYFPELNIRLGLFAPMVVYNPIKPKRLNDPISPSASFMMIIGSEDWNAPNRYEKV